MPIKIRPEDKWFSLYIRARDKWQCQRCYRKYEPYIEGANNSHLKGLHNAHMFGRGAKMTRWDGDNCMALCYGCHSYLDRHPFEKAEFWKEQIGEKRFEELEQKSHKSYYGWKKDAKEISKVYRNAFRAMMKDE